VRRSWGWRRDCDTNESTTKAGTGSFIISSSPTVDGNTGTVDIESVKFAEDAVSGMGTLSMSGSLTNTDGNILLTNDSARPPRKPEQEGVQNLAP